MNIYVGNLSADTTEEVLREAFENYGKLESVNLIKDRYSGESRGFGFVEMPSDEEAKEAIENLNGFNLNGQNLTVNQARPRSESRRNRRD